METNGRVYPAKDTLKLLLETHFLDFTPSNSAGGLLSAKDSSWSRCSEQTGD